MGPITAALVFLVKFGFGLYGAVIVLRIMLKYIQADYQNPLVQLVVKLTKKPVKVLQKWIPDIAKIETAAIVLFIVVSMVKLLLLALFERVMPNIFGLLVWSIGDFISVFLQILFVLVIVRAVLSWVSTANPVLAKMVNDLTDPIMRPIQKHLPPFSGFDFSPLVAIIVLQLIRILFADSIVSVGVHMTLS